MAKMTLQQQICDGLEKLGYKHEPFNARRSRKYIVFIDLTNVERRLFVGKAGALRCGKSVEMSMPVDRLKARAIATSKGEI